MSDDRDFMSRQDSARVGALLARTGITLGMHHGELAKVFRVSRRSVSRWALEGSALTRTQLTLLADLALARDRSLAAEIAAAAGETLVSLGLEAPAPVVQAQVAAPPRVLAPSRLVAAVVCAASDAADVSPRAIRPALLAALRTARELGLTLEAMEAILGATEAPKGPD